MRRQVVAVVGHVDHGKTALVKALTGTDTDTLPEERRRGLTIALGFAACGLPSGTVSLIDAPGHSDFLRTTVSGLSGVDAMILAVSAVEGVEAQTVQHLEIAGMLGVRDVIAVMTKTDIADEGRARQTALEVQGLLQKHGFDHAEIHKCSARTQAGIAELKSSLEELRKSRDEPDRLPGFFLPVDRVFSRSGAGTIVTGTLLGGALAVEDACAIEPLGERSSVRMLQVNGESVGEARPGTRVAVNLRGLAPTSLSKGDVLCAPGQFRPSERLDIVLGPIEGSQTAIGHMEAVVALLGTGHAAARISLYDLKPEDLQAPQYAQLVFERPQVAFAGQRLVLERVSQARALAGARVLDPVAADRRRKRQQQGRVLDAAAAETVVGLTKAICARDGGCAGVDEVARLARRPADACMTDLEGEFAAGADGILVDLSALAEVRNAYLDRLGVLHTQRPLRPLHPIVELHAAFRGVHPALLSMAERQLVAAGEIYLRAEGIALSSHDPFAVMTERTRQAFDQLEAQLQDAAVNPDAHAALSCEHEDAEALIELLVWSGKAVRLYNHALRQSVLLHTGAISDAAMILSEAFPAPANFTTSQAREALGTNRKLIVPLLEYLDQTGRTVREKNLRHFKE